MYSDISPYEVNECSLDSAKQLIIVIICTKCSLNLTFNQILPNRQKLNRTILNSFVQKGPRTLIWNQTYLGLKHFLETFFHRHMTNLFFKIILKNVPLLASVSLIISFQQLTRNKCSYQKLFMAG